MMTPAGEPSQTLDQGSEFFCATIGTGLNRLLASRQVS